MAFALPEDRAGGRWSVTGVTKTYDSKLRGERDGRTDRVGFKKDMYPPAHGFREFATNLRSARREPEYFEGLVNWRLDCLEEAKELLGDRTNGKGAKTVDRMLVVIFDRESKANEAKNALFDLEDIGSIVEGSRRQGQSGGDTHLVVSVPWGGS
jgi:hypothetical protein